VVGYLGRHNGHWFGFHHRQQRCLVLVMWSAHEVALDDGVLVGVVVMVVVLLRERLRRGWGWWVLRTLEQVYGAGSVVQKLLLDAWHQGGIASGSSSCRHVNRGQRMKAGQTR